MGWRLCAMMREVWGVGEGEREVVVVVGVVGGRGMEVFCRCC